MENLTTTDQGKAPTYKDDSFAVDKPQADEARRLVVEDVETLGRDDAAALVKPAPKRYKNFKTRRRLVPIKMILKELQEKQEKEEVRPSRAARREWDWTDYAAIRKFRGGKSKRFEMS